MSPLLNGPGKYDDLCREVQTRTNARGAIVLIFDGDNGNGFSVHAEFEIIATLPEILEQMATEIRSARTQQ